MARRKTVDPKLAVAYLRVSTDKQDLGPEAQKMAIEDWATRHGLTVASWHLDRGVSGGSDLDSRPGVLAALAELQTLRAGVLLVAKRNRLARKVVVAGSIQQIVAKSGAQIICADGAGNGATPADGFMRTILDGAAEYDRHLIGAQTKEGLRVKAARGEVVGGVPFGCRAVVANGRLTKKGQPLRLLEPDPVEQTIIRLAKQLADEGLSLRQIAARLQEDHGYCSRNGRQFQATQIMRMLAA